MFRVIAQSVRFVIGKLGARAAQRTAMRAGEIAFHGVAREQHQPAELVHLGGIQKSGDALWFLLRRFAVGLVDSGPSGTGENFPVGIIANHHDLRTDKSQIRSADFCPTPNTATPAFPGILNLTGHRIAGSRNDLLRNGGNPRPIRGFKRRLKFESSPSAVLCNEYFWSAKPDSLPNDSR